MVKAPVGLGTQGVCNYVYRTLLMCALSPVCSSRVNTAKEIRFRSFMLDV